MRFPPDEKEAIEMVRYAIDHGVNYIDSAYLYKDSEVITGKALAGGYRDKIYLATKSPLTIAEKAEDLERFLDEQLQRLGADYIDIYLLHNLYPGNWEKVKKFDALGFLERAFKAGKIRHVGFSIHSSTAAFKKIVDAYAWEMCQIQLNILDEQNQVGLEGLHYAAKKGLPVVIMEPLRGGSLLHNAPPEALELASNYPEKRSLLEWAFRWLYDMPDVSVILSGTSSLEQIKENLKVFADAETGVMSEEDQKLIKKIREAFEAKMSIGCTGCRYCMPCPHNVDIPAVFKLYNTHQLLKPHPIDKIVYRRNYVQQGAGADRCVSCGTCTKHCPQALQIPELLQQVHAEMKEST
jgi:predicted aldo/keto reductase-like oxidoreductase